MLRYLMVICHPPVQDTNSYLLHPLGASSFISNTIPHVCTLQHPFPQTSTTNPFQIICNCSKRAVLSILPAKM